MKWEKVMDSFVRLRYFNHSDYFQERGFLVSHSGKRYQRLLLFIAIPVLFLLFIPIVAGSDIAVDWSRFSELSVLSESGSSLAFDDSGRLLAIGGSKGTLAVVTLESGSARTYKLHSGKITGVSFNHNSDYLAAGGADGKTKILNLTTGRAEQTFSGPSRSRGVTAVGLNANGTLVAIGYGSGALELWNVKIGRKVIQFKGHRGEVMVTSFNRFSDSLITVGKDKTVKLWNLSAAKETRSLSAGEIKELRSAACSPDGNLIALGCKNLYYRGSYSGIYEKEFIRLINGDGEEVKIFGEDFKQISNMLALGPDGGVMASSGQKGSVRLWNVSTGRQAAKIEKVGKVAALACGCGPLGRMLAACSSSGKVFVWGITGGRPEEPVSSLAVIELQVKGVSDQSLSDGLSFGLSDVARSEVIKFGRYVVLTRDKMKAVLGEQMFQESMASEDPQFRVKVGKLLGAKKIMAGRVSRMGATYVVSMELIDVETGKLEGTAFEYSKTRNEGDLIPAMQKVIHKIMQQ